MMSPPGSGKKLLARWVACTLLKAPLDMLAVRTSGYCYATRTAMPAVDRRVRSQ